jgi:hypothetical protein
MTLNPLVYPERITPNEPKRQADELVPAVVKFFWPTQAHSTGVTRGMGKEIPIPHGFCGYLTLVNGQFEA